MTASIRRIEIELDKVSGLDGVAADKIEEIEKKVKETVKDILIEYLEDSVKELQNNPESAGIIPYTGR